MKIVNYTRGIYFFVGLFGIVLFFGMFAIAPETVFAPKSETELETIDLSRFGKPNEDSIPDANSAPEDIENLSVRLMFAGDIMLARAVEWAIKENDAAYPFARWSEEAFTGADAVIGNFEGTIRETEHLEQTNVMTFDTLPGYIGSLKMAGFTHLSLANNHADDFGQVTTAFTRETLTNHEFVPFGDPFASENFVTHIEGDIPIALLGFHAFNEDPLGIVDAIASEDAAGNFVIVYPHWGTEYEHTPSTYQTAAADAWIAAGADLIIGAHPHVVQSVEVRHGVPVVYSLGNFLFDQDFSAATQLGAIVYVTISQDNILFTFSPVRITDRQMFIDHDAEEHLLSWLTLPALAWTVAREAVQMP